MSVFSRRYGYNTKGIELESASDELKRRIWARFYKQEFDYYDTIEWEHYTTGIEDMMVEMGVPYVFPDNRIVKENNANKLRDFVLSSNKWYLIYDFIERYLNICDDNNLSMMQKDFNSILEDEVSAYRIIEKLVVPITNKTELETIEDASNTKYDAVNTHITKALELFADRRHPDYENSIKESISAIESLCCIITGQNGANATLGKTIKKLKDSGVYIHPALENAFSSIYGYTSDENGIRHGGIDFNGAPAEDAKYMLVSCSAFINYLIEKWRKKH